VRVLQISDTHLSPGKRHFVANWAPLRDWIVRQKPDVTIHTGDLTVDGADVDDDMRHCAELLHALPATVLAVPGNHDVGEAGHARQPVDALRLDRWRRHVGHDWWLHDIGPWRLIGFDSMLLGSGDADERPSGNGCTRRMRPRTDAGSRGSRTGRYSSTRRASPTPATGR